MIRLRIGTNGRIMSMR